MNGSIVLKLNGKYRATIRYRDDHETHDFDTEDEARTFCRDADRNVNGNTHVRKRDVTLFREVQEVQTVIKRVPV